MGKRHNSLASRLTIYLLLITTLLFLILAIVNYVVSIRIWEDKVRLTAELSFEKVFEEVEVQVKRAENVTEQLASVYNAGISADEGELLKLLEQFVNSYNRIVGSALILNINPLDENSDYMFIYYSEKEDSLIVSSDKSRIENELYPIIITPESARWSEPHFDPLSRTEKVITYSVPIHIEGEYLGVLTADLSIDWLDKFVSSMKIYESGFAFLISGNNTILTHPIRKEWIMNSDLKQLNKGVDQKNMELLFTDINDRKAGVIEVKDPYVTENDVYVVYQPLKVLNGSLIMVIPRSEALEGLRKLTWTLIIIAFISLSLLALFIYFIIKKQLSPLKSLAKSLYSMGRGDFDVELPEPKRLDEVGNLNHSFNLMKENLTKHVVLLDESNNAKDKFESEIGVAAKIQNSILPSEPPPALLEKGIDLYGYLQPAKQVGGDLFDYFLRDETHLCFAVGDVTGKGLPASFFMGMTRAYFRSEGKYNQSSNKMMDKINDNLFSNNPEAIFVTLFCGIMDLETGIIDFCNAGHNFPYLYRSDGEFSEMQNQHGTPLGLVEGQKYKSGTLELQSGDALILYTDGISEERNSEGELFGEVRLKNILSELDIKSMSAKKVCKTLIKQVKEFNGDTPQDDDITIFCLKRD